MLVNRRLVFGATLMLFAISGLFAVRPLPWVPWTSPASAFALFEMIPWAALLSVVGGAFIAREAGKAEPSRGKTFVTTTGGTIAAILPVYGFAIYWGVPAFTPLWIPLFVVAVIVGMITGWLTVHVPSIPHWMNRWL